jgi:hypothetical protein
MPFDLVLRGGRVIDPSQKLDAVRDVAFAAGKVVMVGNELSTSIRELTCATCRVTSSPRALSICTPTFIGAAPRSASMPRSSAAPPASPRRSTPAAPARVISRASGKHAIEPSQVRILAYLHVSHAGIFGYSRRVMVGESEEIRLMIRSTPSGWRRSTATSSQPVGGRYTATVELIDPVIDSRSATFGIRLLLSNPNNKIPAGLRCKVEFPVGMQ